MALGAVGVVAAILIPNFLGAKERAQRHRTLSDMRQIAGAVESYRGRHGGAPAAADIGELAAALQPHLDPVPTTDGWGHPLRYGCVVPAGEVCGSYRLVSAGRDGELEVSALAVYGPDDVASRGYDSDLVLADGVFWRMPDS
ncbi:MAG TPA: hypothetical protein VMT79_15575 [Candidatus Binatia bacterium]|nr:hypothetical protein [Candidatus Binatia bacterium]